MAWLSHLKSRTSGTGTLLLGTLTAVLGIEFWRFRNKLHTSDPKRLDSPSRFTIRRAKDELGGWILQETGSNGCSLRFPTWQEAMAEASRRGPSSS